MTTAPTAKPGGTNPLAPEGRAAPFGAWLLLCTLLIGAMAYLRLVLFPERIVPLTYGLPLLVCLWHRDLRLLYGMAIAFSAMACLKVFGLMPDARVAEPWYEWTATGMMLVNIWTVTGVVHALVGAIRRIERKNADLETANAELEASNEELAAREDEISRQNEELQAQTEELEQQTEELRQQAHEMEQQGAELQEVNGELERRERGLETLLDSARWLRADLSEQDVMTAICQAAVQVIGSGACAAAVVQERETRLWLRGHWGLGGHGAARRECAFDRSFASLVLEKGQTAYISDVRTRPDIEVPQPPVGAPLRSVLAAPIWAEGRAVGAVEIYSRQPREWTEDDFRLAEWLAAQAALSLMAIEYQRELDMKRREAEEASVHKTRFLAAVSHDVRTPANAICLMADLLERTATDHNALDDVPQMVRDLKDSARSLVELVSDVLDLARLDAGKLDLQVGEFSLAALIETEVRQFRPLAESKGLQLLASLPPEPLWIRTDKMKLARVLANLVGNAIKFTESGEVRIDCALRPGGGVEIAVADTGVGIPAEDLPRIFDEFHQLRNPERDRNKGSGLGLAICRRLADGLGCSIAVESTAGQGTTFSVRLPADLIVVHQQNGDSSPIDCDTSTGGASLPDRKDDRAPLEGTRILLVEDHDVTRVAAARLLAAYGAIVFQAETGRAALHMLAHERPNVLLLDLMLPDVDGTEVLRHLRHNRPPALRCVLAVSGDVREARVEEVKRLGADGLIPKPLHIETLVEAVRRQYHARQPASVEDRPQFEQFLDQFEVRGMGSD